MSIETSRLRLGRHVVVTETRYRGDPWFVVSNTLSTTHLRVTPQTRQFLACLDGKRTLSEALLASAEAGAAPTLEDAIRILTVLREEGMLETDVVESAAAHGARTDAAKDKRLLNRLMRPLAIQVALFDPARLLTTLEPLSRFLFNRRFMAFYVLVMMLAVGVAISGFAELKTHFSSRFLDPANLFTLWLLYPLVKLVHELSHGLLCRRFGGEVREMGIMLLVFVPVPYVDASSSSAFPAKSKRLLVAAAGILAEVGLAAVGILVWSITEPGQVRDVAFNLALIGSVSTLFFNGNPLLRFDGYYVLSDLVEIPGLAARSNRYLGYLIKRYLFRLPASRSPVMALGEPAWFFTYGLAAGIYRIVLGIVIAIFVASQYFVAGVILALWFVLFQMLLPFARVIADLFREAASAQAVRGVAGRLAVFTLAVGLILFVVPVPDGTYSEGVLIVPEESAVHTDVRGFVLTAPANRREAVTLGQTLLTLENDELKAQARIRRAEATSARVRYGGFLGIDATRSVIAREDLEALTEQAEAAAREVSALVVTAPRQGEFVSLLPSDVEGRLLERGTLVGYIEADGGATARVVVPQRVIDRIRDESGSVKVRLVENLGESIAAAGMREVPLGTRELPTRALGSAAGGDIAVDMRDTTGTQALSPLFELEVGLPPREGGYRVGQKALVKFVHPPVPVGFRLLDHVVSLYAAWSVTS